MLNRNERVDLFQMAVVSLSPGRMFDSGPASDFRSLHPLRRRRFPYQDFTQKLQIDLPGQHTATENIPDLNPFAWLCPWKHCTSWWAGASINVRLEALRKAYNEFSRFAKMSFNTAAANRARTNGTLGCD